ncbi:centrosomal protein of 68 kDa isoform X5 [Falco peregrinus]|uniref:centrosomal protein of 68 kDa isoform X5 n=1 Tax=Falco peregrinus TaxID=8954 RepID=UPI00247A8FD8|nr:centrosomal protein of 68 kDa isoform X5 [Falco peregrinus]
MLLGRGSLLFPLVPLDAPRCSFMVCGIWPRTCLISLLLDIPSFFTWCGGEGGWRVATTVPCVFQRARGLSSSCGRSSAPMAVDMGKSLSEASLSGKAEGDGRWDCAEGETDSLCWLLGTEEAKPCSQGTEKVAMSRRSHLGAGVTQGGSSYCQEVSSASASRFPRARASLSEAGTLVCGGADGGDVPHRGSHQCLSSEEQQVKAPSRWEPAPGPPRRRSSAEESILAGSCHDALASRQSRRPGAQSPFSSTPELLRPQTPPSPESALRSRSASSFSTLSSEGNSPSEGPPRRWLAGTDLPSPAAARDLCWRGVAAAGRAPRVPRPFSLLRIREVSPYQADYWACAIPDSLPPSPDRRSPHWNPNKEYEDLLDYAYPLKPRGFAEDVMAESAGPGSSARPAADGRSWRAAGSPFPNYRGQAKSTSRFLPTTGVLPLRKEWEGDEEFLSLPPRLRELERLAQFLSSLSLSIRTPGHDRRNLPRHSDGRQPLSPKLAPFREAGGKDERGNIEGYAGLWHPCSSQKPSWENTESCGWIHRGPLPGLHLSTGLRDALDGPYLDEPRVKGPPKKSQQSESLAQCVKMFCCQLEELIHWLYNVADITDSWVPPSPDAESVKASLHRYLEFRKDVADHQSLTESVLERGEALLSCMASNSPALKDTLGLIAKQSEELETHAERLYESVLAAVGPVQGEDGLGDKGVQQTAAPCVPPRSDLGCASQPRDG